MADIDFDVAPPAEEVAAAAVAVSETTKPKKDKKDKKEKKERRKSGESSKKRKSRDDEPAADGGKEEAEAPIEAVAAAGGDDDEERPLSHKEKRLAKKRKLAAEQAGEDPEAVAVPAHKAAKPTAAPNSIGNTLVGNTPARSAHGVWIGNMNFATHPRELLAWMADRGLKDVTRINMPGGKRQHENNRGFAYLDFPSAAEVQIAVGLSEQHLDGRKLLIKDSSDFTGRPAASTSIATDPNVPSGSVKSVIATLDPSALERPHPNAAAPSSASNPAEANAGNPSLNRTARKILSRQRNPAGPTLFIGNLGFETVSEDIRDMFDRNQRRSSEWAPGGSEEKKAEKKKGKGKQPADGEEGGSDAESDADAAGDSEDDDAAEEEEGDGAKGDADKAEARKARKEKKDKGPLDLSKAKDAGIRKIRLGTFEDSGKCKGWAFVDFHLPAQATRALLNLHNHQLNGRKLNVEYASVEAVRRGGLGTRSAVKRVRSQRDHNDDGGEDGEEDSGARRGPRRRQDRNGGSESTSFGDVDVRALAVDAASSASATQYRGDRGGRNGGGASQPRRNFDAGREEGAGRRREKEALPGGKRAKPGAALAMAQRASEAIVPGAQGKKVVFD